MHQTQISWEGSPNRSIGGDIRYPPTTKIIGKYKNRKNTEVRKLNKKGKKMQQKTNGQEVGDTR